MVDHQRHLQEKWWQIMGPTLIQDQHLRQNGQHFLLDIFKCTFLNENVWIFINISLKFVSKGPINNFSSIGSDNGLAPTTQQAIIWTNDGYINDTYMHHSASMSSQLRPK